MRPFFGASRKQVDDFGDASRAQVGAATRRRRRQ